MNIARLKKSIICSIFTVGLSLVLIIQPSSGHHSGEMFEREKTVTLSGIVQQFRYINPHSWLLVDIDN